MRTLGRLCIALLLSTGLFAQFRGSIQPHFSGGFGSVVFPGGTSATMPNVTRTFGSVVNPGGGGPRVVVPGAITDPTFGARLGATVAGQNPLNFRRQPGLVRPGTARRTGAVAAYAYPVYVGGGYYENPYPVEQAPQQQPNVTVIYPPPTATPVIITLGSDGQFTATTGREPVSVYQAPVREPVEGPASSNEPSHYLVAFKDHTIYSAVAYWVDGETLHYFTSGNTHNQVSLSLLDRELTERLNRESGIEFRLPPAK